MDDLLFLFMIMEVFKKEYICTFEDAQFLNVLTYIVVILIVGELVGRIESRKGLRR